MTEDSVYKWAMYLIAPVIGVFSWIIKKLIYSVDEEKVRRIVDDKLVEMKEKVRAVDEKYTTLSDRLDNIEEKIEKTYDRVDHIYDHLIKKKDGF